LQEIGVALFIEFSLNDDARLSAVCKPLGLRIVDQECLSDEIVKIRDPLIWQGVGPCGWILVDFLDLEIGRGRREVSPLA
jgi:hypothetical protein